MRENNKSVGFQGCLSAEEQKRTGEGCIVPHISLETANIVVVSACNAVCHYCLSAASRASACAPGLAAGG